MWRRVVTEVAADYPDVELRHGLVDSVAMQHRHRPRELRRARDGEHLRRHPLRRRRRGHRRARPRRLGEPRRRRPGIFEPVHGSAPDIAGTGAREPDRDAALARPGARARRSASRSSRAALEAAVDAAARLDADAATSAAPRRRRSSATRSSPRWPRGGGMSTIVGYPGPAGSHSAAASLLLAPDGCDDRAVRELHRRRRGGGRAPRSRSACCRSRTRSTARSPRRTTCSTRRRSRSSPR